jgi:hypothetical protein
MENKYVVTIREDIYLKNGKTEINAKELLGVISKYGTVEKYDDVVAVLIKEKEEVIENLRKHIETIKEYEVTPEELALLREHRSAINNAVKVEKDHSAKLESTLIEAKKKNKAIIDQIKSAIPEDEEE